METIEVRDFRGARFFWLDNEVIDIFLPQIGSTPFAVYAYLCRFVSNDSQICWPAISTMAERLQLSKSTVWRSLEILESVKLVEVHRGKRGGRGPTKESNRYRLLAVSSSASGTSKEVSSSATSSISSSATVPELDLLNKTQEQLSSPSVPTGGFELNNNPPSKKKQSAADPRHRRFMELIFKAHEHYVRVPPIMGAAAGNNLRNFLKAANGLDEKRFIRMLDNYHASADHASADSPAYYIPKLPKYELGPLNKFGRQDEVMGVGR